MQPCNQWRFNKPAVALQIIWITNHLKAKIMLNIENVLKLQTFIMFFTKDSPYSFCYFILGSEENNELLVLGKTIPKVSLTLQFHY